MIMLNAKPPQPAEDRGTEARCAYLDITGPGGFASSESDTGAMCRVIDVLAELGVEVVSLSATGDLAPREDFDLIINHASARGLRVRLSSSGTMPRRYYERLLASCVDEIAMVVDPLEPVPATVQGNLRYLRGHLPAGKSLKVRVDGAWVKRSQWRAVLKEGRGCYQRAGQVPFHAGFAPPPPPEFGLEAGGALAGGPLPGDWTAV
jgi:hypothetical protein